MSTQPKALRLAEELQKAVKQPDSEKHIVNHVAQIADWFLDDAAAELRRLHAANVDCINHFNAIKAERDALLTVAKELQESAAYWSEYDVPLGIADRLNAVIAKVTP